MAKAIVIVGPTGVGKSALGIQLAKNWQGEIISVDSMQVYQGMDIGTAKVSKEEQAMIPHHLINICTPGFSFSVQEYQDLARKKIEEVSQKKHLPILVGGTGLYIEAVMYDYNVPPVTEDRVFRTKMNDLADREGNHVLHLQLKKVDPVSAKKIHPNDRKRMIRALEVFAATQIPFSEQQQRKAITYIPALWIGLTMPREELYVKINHRVDEMIKQGWIDEVKKLQQQGYHAGQTSMQAIGYREILLYLAGEMDQEEMVKKIKKATRNYAKRQLSWFRRMPDIHWFDVTKNEVYKEIQQLVAGKFMNGRE